MEGTLVKSPIGDFTIKTDDIKQITLGNYISYTMVLKEKIPQSSVFYNLTIEDKAGVRGMFITEYRPTQDWILDQTGLFDGGITTYHGIDLKVDPGDGGGDGGGSGGGGEPDDGTAYPHDCEGEVRTTQIRVPYSCGCGHSPGDDCDGCNRNSPQYPGYEWITTYECYEGSTGGDSQDPNPDPSGGGGATDDPDPELHSITILMPDGSTMETPEILTNKLSLNPNETQMLTEDLAFSDKVYLFIANNQFSEEALAFANEAIDAFVNGGEMDFENHLENYNFHAETSAILAFEQDYRTQMSQAEIAIFDNLTRFQQLDYLHSAFLAKTYSELYYDASTLYNGKGDAYRHTLWNALGAAKLGETLMKQLTDAHEMPDPGKTNNPLEKTMDLHNNQIGRNIGSQSSFMLMMKVKFAVEDGETKYIHPRAPGGGVIPGVSQIIPTN